MTEPTCPVCGGEWHWQRRSIKPYSLAPIRLFRCKAEHEWSVEA